MVLGVNATVIGPVTVGADAVIGAQALVIADVPPGARVLAPAVAHYRPRPGSPPRELLRHTASAGSW